MSSAQKDKSIDVSVLDAKSSPTSHVCDKNESPPCLEDNRSETASKSTASSLRTKPTSPHLSSPTNENNQEPKQIFAGLHALPPPNPTASSTSAQPPVFKLPDKTSFQFDDNQHAGTKFTFGLAAPEEPITEDNTKIINWIKGQDDKGLSNPNLKRPKWTAAYFEEFETGKTTEISAGETSSEEGSLTEAMGTCCVGVGPEEPKASWENSSAEADVAPSTIPKDLVALGNSSKSIPPKVPSNPISPPAATKDSPLHEPLLKQITWYRQQLTAEGKKVRMARNQGSQWKAKLDEIVDINEDLEQLNLELKGQLGAAELQALRNSERIRELENELAGVRKISNA